MATPWCWLPRVAQAGESSADRSAPGRDRRWWAGRIEDTAHGTAMKFGYSYAAFVVVSEGTKSPYPAEEFCSVGTDNAKVGRFPSEILKCKGSPSCIKASPFLVLAVLGEY